MDQTASPATILPPPASDASPPKLPRSSHNAVPSGTGQPDVSIESEAAFHELANNAPIMIWIADASGSCTFLSESWYQFTGQTEEDGLGFGWVNAVHPDDRASAKDVFTSATRSQAPFRSEYRLRRADGEYCWALDSASPRLDKAGVFLGYIGSVIDITKQKKAERLESGQRQVLELIATDAPLDRVFDALVWMVQAQSPTGVIASILLLDGDGKTLRHGAAPGLPPSYCAAIDGVSIGPSVGSCGTAAFRKKPVYVSDISRDPLWKDFAPLALQHGLRACWSTPILSGSGEVLGTIALYHPQVREPHPEDLRIVEVATRTAGIAIERKQARDALTLREQYLRAIIENTPECVKVVDPDGNLLEMNATGLSWVEAESVDQVRGRSVYNVIAPEHRAAFREMNRRVCSGSREEFQFELVGMKGTRRWMETHAGPVRHPVTGQVVQLAITRDVTAAHRTEEALRLSRERLKLVIEASKVGFWFCDLPFGELNWDARVKEHFWLPSDSRVTIDLFYDRMHPDDRQRVQGEINSSLSNRKPYDIEYRTISPAGQLRWVRAIGRGYYDHEGKPFRFDGVTIDVTETKQREAELAQSAERLRFMAESMPQKIFTADARGRLSYVNRQWTEFTGLPPESLLGEGWMQAVHPEDAALVAGGWEQSVSTGATFQMEHRCRAHDGQYRWHLARAHAMRDPQGQIEMWIGSVTDIDDQKQAEAGLERIVSERTSKLQEIIGDLEAFSYSVSHDLRSPLRAMQGYSQELLDGASAHLSPTHRLYLERIQRASARLDRLTLDLLAYSRLANLEITAHRVDVAALVDEIIEQYPNLHDSGAEFSVERPTLDVIGHEAFLSQAISNLLSNAVKFTSPDRRPVVRVRTIPSERGIQICVEDNGIGIEPRHYDRIFQIFGRVHPEQKFAGTGIGLAIVKKTAERMKGRVGFDSVAGQGSRFWIELPAAQ